MVLRGPRACGLRPRLWFLSIDEIPHKSLGVQVNVFANKLKVRQHRDHKEFADVAYYGLYHQNKIQN